MLAQGSPGIIILAYCCLGLFLLGCGSKQPSSSSSSQSTTPQRRTLSAEQLYIHCQACHGADGLGIRNMHPPLDGSPYLANDEAMAKVILHGYRSQAWAGVMTGFESRLSDRDVATLVNWMRYRWAPQAGELSSDTVRRVRAQGPRRQPWTPDELPRDSAQDEDADEGEDKDDTSPADNDESP